MTFTEDYLKKCEIKLDTNEIENMVNILEQTRTNKGRLFIIGSGGGAGNASHAVCDFRKLCNIESYAPYDNISELTARVNDENWETTISNYLITSNLNENDTIMVFSVGGGNEKLKISMNIVNALKYAMEKGSKIVGIVGSNGGFTKKVGDSVISIPSSIELITPITEAYQSIIWHLLVSHPKLQINKTTW